MTALCLPDRCDTTKGASKVLLCGDISCALSIAHHVVTFDCFACGLKATSCCPARSNAKTGFFAPLSVSFNQSNSFLSPAFANPPQEYTWCQASIIFRCKGLSSRWVLEFQKASKQLFTAILFMLSYRVRGTTARRHDRVDAVSCSPMSNLARSQLRAILFTGHLPCTHELVLLD